MQNANTAKIEHVFLEKLIDLLKSGGLTPEESKVITTEFLKCIDNNQVDFGTSLRTFTTKYAHFKSIYTTYLELDESNKTKIDFPKKNMYHLYMDNIVNLRIITKKEYLTMVANFLESDILTLERAKEPTKAFKVAVEADNIEALKENIKNFCDQNPIFANLNSFLLSKIDSIQIDQLKAKMESMIGGPKS